MWYRKINLILILLMCCCYYGILESFCCSTGVISSSSANNNHNQNDGNDDDDDFVEKEIKTHKINDMNKNVTTKLCLLSSTSSSGNCTTSIKKTTSKTRTLVCCDGYHEVKTYNGSFCHPVCVGGCIRGHCHQPNKCLCDDGYFGLNCNQRCRRDKWGRNCEKDCNCKNGALCDRVTGSCRCLEGWIGINCNTPCPEGFYGIMCKKTCKCGSNKKCNPFNGTCLTNGSHNFTQPIIDSTIVTTTDGVRDGNNPQIVLLETSKIPRIEVENWKRVNQMDQNFEYQEDNGTTSVVNVNHTVILNALNSSLANLTENIEKLSKKVDEQNEKDTNTGSVSGQLSLLVEHVNLETTVKNDVHLILGSPIYDTSNIDEVISPNDSDDGHHTKQIHPPYTFLIIICIIFITILIVIRIVKSIKLIRTKRKQFDSNLRAEDIQPPPSSIQGGIKNNQTIVSSTHENLSKIIHIKPTRPRKVDTTSSTIITTSATNSLKKINKPLPALPKAANTNNVLYDVVRMKNFYDETYDDCGIITSSSPASSSDKPLENDTVSKLPEGNESGVENNAYFPVDHVYDEINYMDNSVPKAPRRKLTPQTQQFIV